MDRARSQLDIFGVLQKRITALEAEVALLRNQNLALPDWITLTYPGAPNFQNGFGNYGGGYAPVGFWRDSNGIVWIRGLAAGGSVGAVIFTLPEGFRPSYVFLPHTEAGSAFALFQVWPSGNVNFIAGTTNYISMEMSFRVGQ